MPDVRAELVDVYAFRPAGDGVEFLLLERAAGDYLGGTWHPVSGTIERGETGPQAAVRELHEETGLDPQRLWQVDSVGSFYVAKYDRVLMTIGFVAEVGADIEVRLSDEHAAFRWEAPETFAATLLWPAQRRMFAELLEEILGGGPAEALLRVPLG